MKKTWRVLILFVIVVVVLNVGCAGQPIKMKADLNRNYDKAKGRTISVTANSFQLFLLIPIRVNSRQVRAYNALMREAGDDYVTDIKIREEWQYALVGTIYRTTIEATAYPRL